MLDLIDIVLGISTVLLVYILGKKVIEEILERRRMVKSRRHRGEDDNLIISDVGVTMADGGVPLDKGPTQGKGRQVFVSKDGKIEKKSDDINNEPSSIGQQ